MKVIRGIENIKKKFPHPVVTIGNFDGVHIGHQKIFSNVLSRAKEAKGTAIAITFDPHPIRIMAPEKGVKMLTPLKEKTRLIERAGMDVLLLIDFNKEFASLRADDFIRDVLIEKLGASHIIVGHNYKFGKGKRGTTELLRRRGRKYGFKVNIIRNARRYNSVVSSSRIRSLLLRGRVCEASTLLGRSYHIEGDVISGAGRGAKILDTPTANLSTPNELVPKDGVYVVKVQIGKKIYDGVANIGINPTFGKNEISYETHLFSYCGDLYGKKLKMFFIDRLRDERAFKDPAQLKVQIEKDIETAQFILSKHKGINIDL
ncbi:MAG: bifunctional riboflavin kinase/FAD synthetase [Nitrospirota bacterium]|nr:MAG: bifunctional riboflavin kinase/FAD synthetase [Nitrospirota bacterium]